jgi:protein-tyrosine phosphatase
MSFEPLLSLMCRFELNTANAVLFDNLSLDGFEEVLPGRLFTTRMPRKIHEDPSAAERFKAKVAENSLSTVLILTESKEYEQYAGADLEEFYRSLGLEIIHRPIVDFSLPDYPMIVANVEDLTMRLAEGKHCLVHCAGGSGRTGMVIASVMKNMGVQDPIAWVRRVKTSYVETPEQEHFVRSLPPVINPEIAAKCRGLARAIAAEQLVDTVIRGAKTAVQVQRALFFSPAQLTPDALLSQNR